jgi:uncharacterized membrane protein YsdA (DUF1294 family)
MPSAGTVFTVLAVWFAAVSALAVILTVYDKRAAKTRPRHRVRERTLLAVGFFGGAAAMLCTMLLIRHKTQHKKFMVGLPLMIALHAVAAAAAVVYFIFLR